ncbi:hypothetical protein MMC10_000526 [Thelotrema lepadinum]|nr:hypothetical protein [Thelotrema lepadinum]
MSPISTPTKSSSGPNAIPHFERQVLTSQALRELRWACALIVKETGPSGAELQAILNQPDPLDTYNKEVAKVRAKASSTQPKAAKQKDRTSKSNLVSVNQSSTTLPLPRPHSNVYTSHHKSTTAISNTKPVDNSSLIVSPVTKDKQLVRKSVPVRDQEALDKIRSSMNLRPKTSAAASVDYYIVATAGSSGSTTRSNTTLEPHISTNVTSYNQTPADDKRGSYQFPKRSTSRTASAPGRRAEDGSSSHEPDRDLLSPNPDYVVPSLVQHARTAPTQSMVSREPSRPRSRASSIKDSIFGGIRDYIQPRPSLDILSRSASRNESTAGSRSSSRPPSRGSSFSQSSRGWIKNAANGLRRKGSFSSWKPNRLDDENRGRNRNKGPDLNRSLPPLPGLDSYKEPKVHISQMMTKSPPPVETEAPKMDSKASVPSSPWSPGHQNTTTTGMINPQNNAKSFPRIPFSDSYAPETRQSQALSPRHLKESPQERQARESERRRQRQERSRKTLSKELTDPVFERKREEEIRRAVREKIMRGGMTEEAFNAEESTGQQEAQQGHPAASSGRRLPQHGLKASFKARERHKKLERENEEATKRSRGNDWNDKSHDVASNRLTLKSRLSRMMRHDHGQGNVIIAN